MDISNIFRQNDCVIVIDPARYTKAQLSQLHEAKPENIVFALKDSRSRSNLRANLSKRPITEHSAGNDYPQKKERFSLSSGEKDKASEVLNEIKRDPNIHLFMDRENSAAAWKSSLSPKLTGSHHFESVVQARCLEVLGQQFSDPMSVSVRPSTPHGLATYIECFVLERLGVPVLYVGRSAVPGFSKLFSGFGSKRREIKLGILSASSRAEYKSRAAKELEKRRLEYAAAMPDYERIRIERNRGAIFSPMRYFLRNLKRPSATAHALKCWSALNRSCVPFSGDTRDCAIFFLHYQPERTSLPEASQFAVQLSAILEARLALPDDMLLLVKEHPSTFSNRCDFKWRSKEFYSQIAAIPGVQFVDISTDTFELIDHSSVVITLTGTVGLEALMRGTPAVFLGSPMLSGVFGQHVYHSFAELQKFLIKARRREFTSDAVIGSVTECLYEDFENIFEADEFPKFHQNCAEMYSFYIALFNSLNKSC